jgi:lysophospholipase L1-like esterase
VDAAIYVIDCNPNTEKKLIYDRCVALVKQLRQLRPNVPVLLVENFMYDWADFRQERENLIDKRKELKRAFETLRKSGITRLYYQAADGMVGGDHEGTVDGVHPTDLGMLRIADFLLPELKYILSE